MNTRTFLPAIALVSLAAAVLATTVVAQEPLPEGATESRVSTEDSIRMETIQAEQVSTEDSIRIETILAEIESMKSVLQQLHDELGKRATTNQFSNLTGTVSLLLKRYETLDDSITHGQRNVKSLIIETKNMAEDLKNIRIDTHKHGQSILTITRKELAKGKTKYESDVKDLRAHQKLLTAMRNTLNSLDSAVKQEDYASAVRQITSPTSDSLGFSIFTGARFALQTLETELKKKKVKRLGGVPFHRIANFVTQALKSPLASATSISPLSAGLSSVASFVTGLAVKEKKVEPGDLQTFNETLKPYVDYYARLDAANAQLRANLAVTEAQSRAVRVSMNNWIFEKMEQMKIESDLSKEKDALSAKPETTNRLLNEGGPYSQNALNTRIAEITFGDKAEPNYEALADDSRLHTSFLAQNQLVGIAQHLESVVKDYREAFVLYQSTLASVFVDGTREITGADRDRIRRVIENLGSKHKTALSSFDNAVNLDQIRTMLAAVRAQ